MHKKEYEKVVENLTLEDIEMRKGHILGRHFNMSDSDLIHRCIQEKKSLATTFNGSRAEILKLIQETLLDEEFETPECILEWLDDASDGGDFFAVKDFPNVIGHGFFREAWHDWKQGAVSCSSCIVVLRKVERQNDTIFRIISSYPSVTEDDIRNFKKEK